MLDKGKHQAGLPQVKALLSSVLFDSQGPWDLMASKPHVPPCLLILFYFASVFNQSGSVH